MRFGVDLNCFTFATGLDPSDKARMLEMAQIREFMKQSNGPNRDTTNEADAQNQRPEMDCGNTRGQRRCGWYIKSPEASVVAMNAAGAGRLFEARSRPDKG